jgi:hypothetical protein
MTKFDTDKIQAIKGWNSLRRANKGKWVTFHAQIDGRPLAVKSYGTWIQRCVWKGTTDGGPIDCTVKVATDWLDGIIK